jgi:hypothetical protein
MQTKKLNTFQLVCALGICASFFLFSTNVNAQNSLNAAGGDASNNDYKVSFSYGELFYNSLSQPGYYFSQGMQHPTITILEITSSGYENEIGLDINVFPNPATEKIHLKVDLPNGSDVFFRLFDINGKLLRKGTAANGENIIPISEYPVGSYLFSVYNGTDKLKTFKILKNK